MSMIPPFTFLYSSEHVAISLFTHFLIEIFHVFEILEKLFTIVDHSCFVDNHSHYMLYFVNTLLFQTSTICDEAGVVVANISC